MIKLINMDKIMNKTKFSLLWILIILLTAAMESSAFASRKPLLDPISEEFISTARYLLSRKDKKTLSRLEPKERHLFIREFWKLRDPDPYTEINEFKNEYLNRIATANKIFYEGPTPGWLQDRGRIFILLGPPDERIRFNNGFTRDFERWNYFRRREIAPLSLIFINLELTVNSLRQLSRIQNAMVRSSPQITPNPSFDFSAKIHGQPEAPCSLLITVPYTHIWMSENNAHMETSLSLLIKLYRGSEKDACWAFKKDYPLTIESERFEEYIEKAYQIEIPLRLASDRYVMEIEIRNSTDGKKAWKTLKFRR